MKTWAIVTFQFEGIHKWEAPLKEVEFLGNPHRHIFYVTIKIEQFHDNRDIEYILFKRKMSLDMSKLTDCGTMSCEQLAKKFVHAAVQTYPNRDMIVKVMEDNENGAIVEHKGSDSTSL